MLALAYGLYRKSRTCAILLFSYHVANRLSVPYLTSNPGYLIGVAPVTYAAIFFLGILGTFAHHTLAKVRLIRCSNRRRDSLRRALPL